MYCMSPLERYKGCARTVFTNRQRMLKYIILSPEMNMEKE